MVQVGWEIAHSGALVYHAQGPGFNLQFHLKKKTKRCKMVNVRGDGSVGKGLAHTCENLGSVPYHPCQVGHAL